MRFPPMKKSGNLLILSNTFPNDDDRYIGDIFVKEQIKYLKNFFDQIYVISPLPYGTEYLRHIKQCNYKFNNVQVFFPKYFNNPIFYFYLRNYWVSLAQRAIINCIKKNNITFDVIHAHYTWPSGAIGISLKKMYNVPLIITEHTSITFKKNIDKKDPVYINTWKNADAIIRVRHGDMHIIESVGISREKLFFIPNGFDPQKFHPMNSVDCRRKLQLPEDKKIILTVGNLNSVKGHHYLIDAIRMVVSERKDILCIIVGSGKLKPTLEHQINLLQLNDYILLAGGQPHDEIPIWMNACDIFVLPSLTEGNPTVMFEALGCGKPFIGTNVGGIPEIIKSGVYGLLVTPENPDDLKKKILLALDWKWDHESILSYAEQFSWIEISNEIMKIYNHVSGKRL
jgi:glycosyltransferase involved in cell wall biosynthesis